MSTNRISANLSQTDRDAIISAVETIKQKLPFLIELSPDERKTLDTAADELGRRFVRKVKAINKNGPLPSN